MWGEEIFYLGNTINRVELSMRAGKGKTHLKNMNALGNHFFSVQKYLLGNFTHFSCMIFSHFSLICVTWGLGVEVERTALFLNLQNCRSHYWWVLSAVYRPCWLSTLFLLIFDNEIIIFAWLISSHSSDITNVSSQITHIIQSIQSDTLPHHPFLFYVPHNTHY